MSCGKCKTCACTGKKEPAAFIADESGFIDKDGKSVYILTPLGRDNAVRPDLSILDGLAEGPRAE
ncbi:hypothetical protein [Erwinia phage vB_Ea277G]|jgi:hypothetical protein|nr:hypothetical protein [Erwinia phage vB_Ea277G]